MSFFAERRIRHWLANAFQSRSWERFDSLPLPRVDARFAPRETWVQGSIWCLDRAGAAHRRARYPLAVAMSFDLVEAGVDARPPRTLTELGEPLGEEPPALTAFPPGGEFDELVRESPCDPTLFGPETPPELVCAMSSWSLPEEPETAYRALYAGFLAPS